MGIHQLNQIYNELILGGTGTEMSPYQLHAAKIESSGSKTGEFIKNNVIPNFNVLEDGAIFLECHLAVFELSFNASKAHLTLKIHLKKEFLEERGNLESSYWLKHLITSTTLLDKSPKQTTVEFYSDGEELMEPSWAQRAYES